MYITKLSEGQSPRLSLLLCGGPFFEGLISSRGRAFSSRLFFLCLFANSTCLIHIKVTSSTSLMCEGSALFFSERLDGTNMYSNYIGKYVIQLLLSMLCIICSISQNGTAAVCTGAELLYYCLFGIFLRHFFSLGMMGGGK